MSQKVRHTRKSTDEVEKGEFKAPSKDNSSDKNVENGVTEQKEQKKQSEQKDNKKQTENNDSKKQGDQKKQTEQKDQKKQPSKTNDAKEANETNGKEKDLQNGEQIKMTTRSRSTTPQKKKKPENDVSVEETIQEESLEDVKAEEKLKNGESEMNGQGSASESEVTNGEDIAPVDNEKVEMDTLVLTSDEPDPELEFDESSDLSESGKGSPVISRCRTRRSQTRNIPTPKTPKSQEDEDIDKSSIATPLSESTDSDVDTPKKAKRGRPKKQTTETDEDSVTSDNISTRAEAGSDTTRLEFTNQDSGISDENSFLNQIKNRSLEETLRIISPRKSIRQVDGDFRKRVLRDNQEKFKQSYFSSTHNSVEIVSAGLKRKNRSESPEDIKRIKLDSSGIFAKITSPLLNIKNKFSRSQLPTSTPKLTGYKLNNFANNDVSKIILNGDEDKNLDKKWCTIM